MFVSLSIPPLNTPAHNIHNEQANAQKTLTSVTDVILYS